MNIRKAIEEIKFSLSYVDHKDDGYIDCIKKETMETCIEALEKQLPEKPEFIYMLGNFSYMARCPRCTVRLVADIRADKNKKYCWNCGQRFDWRDDD